MNLLVLGYQIISRSPLVFGYLSMGCLTDAAANLWVLLSWPRNPLACQIFGSGDSDTLIAWLFDNCRSDINVSWYTSNASGSDCVVQLWTARHCNIWTRWSTTVSCWSIRHHRGAMTRLSHVLLFIWRRPQSWRLMSISLGCHSQLFLVSDVTCSVLSHSLYPQNTTTNYYY